MYWRRFAVADIPLETQEAFDVWLRERWYEKDALMEEYMTTGRFPSDSAIANGDKIKFATSSKSIDDGYVETEVKPAHWWEFGQIFVVLAGFGLVANLSAKVYNVAIYGNMLGWGH
jgi:lysocardiolipin and lysophospholipid acyltransferase